MLKVTTAIGMLFFMLLGGGAANAGVWDLSGTATLKAGKVSESSTVTAVLTLAEDRTYTLDYGEGVIEMGAWFEIKGKLMLYTQNLLEQIEEMEDLLADELGEPVEVTPVSSKGKAAISSKTGLLSIQNNSTYQAYLPILDATIKFQLGSKLTGIQR